MTNYEERDFEIKANYEYAKQYKLSLLVYIETLYSIWQQYGDYPDNELNEKIQN